MRRAAIVAAHKRRLKFTGHLCSVSFREAVALGIDNLEHGLFTNRDLTPNRTPDRCSPDMRTGMLKVAMDGPDIQADDPRDGDQQGGDVIHARGIRALLAREEYLAARKDTSERAARRGERPHH
ncbi:MAG: hypothetical protein ACRD2N_05955 [Vicinamibacterales bacterium]